MADIDFGTGPGTGDTVRQALEKLQARIDALATGGGNQPNPAPVFVVQPSISPTSGQVGTTFTANDGQASNATSYSRRWLLDGTSIGTGTTVVPVVAGSLVLEVTAENVAGMVTATSQAVTVAATPTPTASTDMVFFAGSSTPQRAGITGTGTPNANLLKSTDGTTSSPHTTTGAGEIAFGNAVIAATGRKLSIVNKGAGGTSAANWNAASSTDRAALVSALNAAKANADINILGVVLGVGYNDASDLTVTSQAQHLALIRSLIGKIRSESGLPNLRIFFSTAQINNSTSATGTDQIREQLRLVRQAEMQMLNEGDANVTLFAHSYDLAKESDGVHQTAASYVTWGTRGAASVVATINGTAAQRGPRITGTTQISDTVTDVSIAHVAGNDFTPTSGLTGFGLSVDNFANILAVSSAARTNATTVRLTHATKGTSPAILRYMMNPLQPDVSGTLYSNTNPPFPLDPTAGDIAVAASSGGGTPTPTPTQTDNVMVANRMAYPNDSQSLSQTTTARREHYASPQGAITNLRPQFMWNFLNSNGSTGSGAAASLKHSIEYPEGVFHPTLWSGVRELVTASNANYTADVVVSSVTGQPLEIPAGAKFWERTVYITTGGKALPTFSYPASVATMGVSDGKKFGDLADTDTIPTDTSSVVSWGMTCMKGTVKAANAKAVIVFGDSLSVGQGENAAASVTGSVGMVSRKIDTAYPCFIIARGGYYAQNYATLSGGAAFPNFIAQLGATHVVVQAGLNDLSLGSRTAAQVMADRQTIIDMATARIAGITAVHTTITPRVNTTDNYATVANQTPKTDGNMADLTPLNTLIRAKPLVMEYADAAMSARDSNVFSGPFPPTNDGTHMLTPKIIAVVSAVNMPF